MKMNHSIEIMTKHEEIKMVNRQPTADWGALTQK